MTQHSSRRAGQAGFSFIDVMIGMTILLIGVLALGGAMAGALIRTEESEEQLVAKQYATTTIESIFSARDVSTLGFAAAQNTTGANCTGGPGVFCSGQRNIKASPGTDGIFGTVDDSGLVVSGYTRQIEISNVNDEDGDGMDDTALTPVSLRRIRVTIFYRVRSATRQVTITALIGDYRYLS
jgi:hypothetical protein